MLTPSNHDVFCVFFTYIHLKLYQFSFSIKTFSQFIGNIKTNGAMNYGVRKGSKAAVPVRRYFFTGAPVKFTGGPLNITGAPLYFTGSPLYLPVDG